MTSPSATTSPDLAAVERARARIRLLRAARGAVVLALWGLAAAVVVLLLARLGWLGASRAKVGLALALALPLVGAAAGLARTIPPLAAARRLDDHFRLHDRLSSALEFRALPAGERTPWMEAAIDDAAEAARALRPEDALPWRWPAEARGAVAMALVLAAVGAVEFRVARVVREAPRRQAAARDPLVLEDDDLRAFRELSRELERRAVTPASRDAVREVERFLDDVSQRRLEREEAWRRLAALERDVEAGQRDDRDGLRERLADMGRRMESPLTRELSEALQRGDLQRARASMEQLAQRLREDRTLSEQQRRELQRALSQGAAERDRAELQRRVEQARREVEEMLRRQRERALSQGEQQQLRDRQRQAEHLEREQRRDEALRREVERLQREISQAARDVARDQGAGAQGLQRGAEELSRMEREESSQQSLEELRQRLQELRDQLRQQNGQNGQQQRTRLARFFRQAGGQQGGGQQGGGQQGGGQQGAGQQGAGQQGGAGGQQGNGQQGGAGGQQGNGQQGGAGGQLGNGQQGGAGGQQGGLVAQGVGAQSTASAGATQGAGAGVGHEDDARGAAARTAGATQAVQVHGQQTGNGPTRSQVIRGAASGGFASAPYRQVYTPYWDRAREVLHQAEVPAGYRSYVRRYFQLIRPRGED